MFASKGRADAKANPVLARRGDAARGAWHIEASTVQRSLGNQYFHSLATASTQSDEDDESIRISDSTRRPVQARLTIGAVNDPAEQEADSIARQVMRIPDATLPAVSAQGKSVRRKSAPQRFIQTKQTATNTTAASARVESGIQSIGPGQPLPGGARSFFESRFGHDFGGVRVHTGDAADGLNRSLSARAFTSGQGIFFRNGEYNPDSHGGRELLAHELTHVLQQGGGVRMKSADDSDEPKKVEPTSAITPDSSEDSEIVTGVPSIQRDFAIQPPHADAAAAALTDAQVQEANRYNTLKLGAADAAFLGKLRDVLGIPADPPAVDEDFANGVARWQAANGLTQDGKLGPDTAAPLFRELRAEGLSGQARTLAGLVRRGRVRTGPTYNPHGVVNVPAGAVRNLPFAMAATFDNDPDNGIFASCCEVRQELSWDAAAAASFTAITGHPVPHNGFPAAQALNTRIEDRNAGDTLRYGHRTGFTAGVNGNRYLNAAGNLAQADGTTFEGHDNPTGPAALAGQWVFRLSVVDVCNDNKQIGATDTLTINW